MRRSVLAPSIPFTSDWPLLIFAVAPFDFRKNCGVFIWRNTLVSKFIYRSAVSLNHLHSIPSGPGGKDAVPVCQGPGLTLNRVLA
jgi:hypothetical protein